MQIDKDNENFGHKVGLALSETFLQVMAVGSLAGLCYWAGSINERMKAAAPPKGDTQPCSGDLSNQLKFAIIKHARTGSLDYPIAEARIRLPGGQTCSVKFD